MVAAGDAWICRRMTAGNVGYCCGLASIRRGAHGCAYQIGALPKPATSVCRYREKYSGQPNICSRVNYT